MFGFGSKNKVQDPVCLMKIDKEKAKFFSDYKGEKYYFCSENCKKQFDSNPKSFTGEALDNKVTTKNKKCCCC